MRIQVTVTGVNRKLSGPGVVSTDVTLIPSRDQSAVAGNAEFWNFLSTAPVVFTDVKDSVAGGLVVGSDFYLDFSPVS